MAARLIRPDLGLLPYRFEQSTHRDSQNGVNAIGRNLAERNQHETSLMQMRVRDYDRSFLSSGCSRLRIVPSLDHITVQQQVDVDVPGAACDYPPAPEFLLYREQSIEERPRPGPLKILNLDHLIQEPGLIRVADRLRFVDR